MKDLKQTTIRGAVRKACSQTASFVPRIGFLIVLAEYWIQRTWGSSVWRAESIRDFGLSSATVQHPLELPRAPSACALAGVARPSAHSPPPPGCHADARHDSAQSARLLCLASAGTGEGVLPLR